MIYVAMYVLGFFLTATGVAVLMEWQRVANDEPQDPKFIAFVVTLFSVVWPFTALPLAFIGLCYLICKKIYLAVCIAFEKYYK